MSKVVAIHQPNFFPWLGYFDKILKSDEFVFFDDCQFPKKGGAWSNRVKLLIGGVQNWVTGAIDRDYSGFRNINEMVFLNSINWQKKILKSLDANYRRHPYFNETMEVILPLLLNSECNISTYNISTVTKISEMLDLDTSKLRKSSDFKSEGKSNALLCSLTKLCGGTTYMCGGGADGYQDESIFLDNGISLKHQNYIPKPYEQFGCDKFEAGLSVIDILMNLGWNETSRFIKS